MRKLLSVTEVAKRLGLSRMQVIRKIKKGEIPAERIGRSYAIPDDGLPGVFKKITLSEKKTIEQSVRLVVRTYGDVIRRLGRE